MFLNISATPKVINVGKGICFEAKSLILYIIQKKRNFFFV